MRWPRSRSSDRPGPQQGPGASSRPSAPGSPDPRGPRTTAQRLSRDRHGRGIRGPLAWPAVPAMTTRALRFDDCVLDAMERIGPKVGDRLDAVEVAVQLVPDVRDRGPVAVPLAETFATQSGSRARIVLYRRPLEARATTEDELADLVGHVLVEQVAQLLFLDPYDLDDRYDPGD